MCGTTATVLSSNEEKFILMGTSETRPSADGE